MKIRLPSIAAIAAAVVAAASALAADAAKFTLVQARTGEAFGPFEARQGEVATIGRNSYKIEVEGSSRLVFVQLGSGREFGPVEFVAGRMVEINGAFYRLANPDDGDDDGNDDDDATESHAQPEAPRVHARRASSQGDYAPPPVPPPVVSEIESQNTVKRVVAPHPKFPAPDPGLCAYMWVDPVHVVPYKWEIGGKKGKSSGLEYFAVGGNSVWNGWTFDFSLIGGADAGSIVPSGLAVDEASLDGGSGFSIGGGYSHPFMRKGPWEVVGGARLFYTSIGMDLKSRTMTTYATTSTTNLLGEVTTHEEQKYKSSKASADFTEWGVWLDFGASYVFDDWLFKGGMSIAPFTSAELDASLHGPAGDYKIEADRRLPLSGWLGVEYGLDAWRLTATLTLGSDNMLRLGALYVF